MKVTLGCDHACPCKLCDCCNGVRQCVPGEKKLCKDEDCS